MRKYLIIFISLLVFFTKNVYALDIDLKSENVLIYNLSENKIVYEQNSEENTKIASLTKIITVLVALENIQNLDDKITLTEEVFNGLVEADASVAGFKTSETVSYKDLLYGALLPSGADATRALAINLFGNEQNFVQEMNKLMAKLEIKSTYFTNTSGLDEDGQKATLKDLLKIMLYAFKNDRFMEIFNSQEYTISNGRLKLLSTLNYYEKKYSLDISFIKGSKTGYTNQAGLCLISYAQKEGLDLLVITTKAPIDENRYPYNVTDAIEVYNYYFNNYKYEKLLTNNQIITDIKTRYSKNNKMDLVYKGYEFRYLLPVNYNRNDIKFNYRINKEYVSFLTNLEEPIGKFSITYENNEIYSNDLFLKEKVDFSIYSFIAYYKYLFCLLILSTITIFHYKKKN